MARRKKKLKPKAAMLITEARKKTIDELAHLLADLAPATARGKSFCVEAVARKKGLSNCWKDKGNKRKSISVFFQNVFRKFEQKPSKVVIAIIDGGVKWSAKRGRAVSRDELARIAEKMAELGFNIKKRLAAIELPGPSRVTPPTLDLAAVIDRLDLHASLKDDCLQMFKGGHLNEAVRKALERFEKKIQHALGDHSTIGKSLMATAFKKERPGIAINEMKTGNDESEQEGFMLLTMGAMAGMRNLYSHGDVATMSPMDAFERLAFVSLLFKRVDKAL